MWIETSEIKDRWLDGEVPATDEQLEKLIADAEDILTSAVPDLETKIASADIPVSRVIRIGVQMIHRKLQNPKGMRSSMEMAGSFSVQNTFGGTEPGSMYLTEAELKELKGKTKRKVTAIQMTGW